MPTARGMMGSLALLAIAIAGCAAPASPVALSAHLTETDDAYVLVSVAGEALPATTVRNDVVTVSTIADSIWLSPDGTGRRVMVERSHSTRSLPPGELTRRSEHLFRYSLATTGAFEGSLACRENGSCVPPPHYRGTVTADRLTLTHALYYRVPLEYRRRPR